MFRDSAVRLTQKFRGDKAERFLYVKLLEPKTPAVQADLKLDEIYKYIANYMVHFKTFTYWGEWMIGRSSKAHFPTPSYSLGRPDSLKLWVFNLHAQQVHFLDLGKDGGPDQLTHPRRAGEMKAAADLHNVRMTSLGIVPAGENSGYCAASDMFVKSTIAWTPVPHEKAKLENWL